MFNKKNNIATRRSPVATRNALTFDIEEHFQVHAFEEVISRTSWDRFPSRVEGNTRLLLSILDEHQTRATFFILGWVADRNPLLVAEIAERGHEVATHGYSHELVYRLSPREFRADIRRSIRSIEGALGRSVQLGYRAPAFSITSESSWALNVLRDEGILFDSSVFPVSFHDRYGVPESARSAHEVIEGLWEIPLSTMRFANRNWPVAGGGYFRLYPLRVTRQAIHQLNAEGLPAVVYLHPWEFDPDQPRVTGASRLSRFRHYVNLHATENKLRTLLSEFKFGPLCEVFEGNLRGIESQEIPNRTLDVDVSLSPEWARQTQGAGIAGTKASVAS